MSACQPNASIRFLRVRGQTLARNALSVFSLLVAASFLTAATAAEPHHTVRFFNKYGKPQTGFGIAFSPTGKELALATDSGTTLIRVRDGEQTASVKATGNKLGYSSDGQFLLLASKDAISRLNCATRQAEPLKPAAPPPGYVGMKFGQKNGKTIVEQIYPGGPAQRDGRISVGDEIVAIGRDRRNEPKSILGFSPKQISEALAGTPATAIEFFVIPQGANEATVVRLVRTLARTQPDGAMHFYAISVPEENPALVCLVRDGRCELIDPANGRIVSYVPTQHLPSIHSAILAPDGQQVALVGKSSKGRVAIECVDVLSNLTTASYDLPDESSYDVCFMPDGKSVLTLSSQRIFKLDTENLLQPVAFNQEGLLDSRTLPGAYVVGGHQLDQVFNFQAFGGGFRWRVVVPNPNDPQPISALLDRLRTLRQASVSKEGVLAIGTVEGDIHLLDAATGTPMHRLGKKGDGEVELLEFSADGHWLAYYLAGTLHIVDVSSVRSSATELGKIDRIAEGAEDSTFTVNSAEGAFSATFPSKPQFDAAQGKYEAQQDNGRVKYSVVFMNFGKTLAERTKDPAHLRDIYDTVGSSFAKHTKGRIEETTDHDTEPVVERSIRWTFPQGDKEMRTHARLTARGGRLYILSVTQQTPEKVSQVQIESFFSAFKPRDTGPGAQ